MEFTTEQIIEELKTVKDPELGLDIYSLGLIYDIKIGEAGIDILMTLTTPFCPYADAIIAEVVSSLKKFAQEVRVDITFEPEWTLTDDLKISLGLT